jgi:hypothetical protein
MAQKGKVKGIRDNTGGGDGATMATSSETATATAPTAIVTIVDAKSGMELEYEQPNYKGLLFNVDDLIRYETINVPGAAKPIVVSARRFQAGTITSITDACTGVLTEKITGKTINFYQPSLKELGITAGASVKYDLVPGLKGEEIAVNVEADV